jgi:hypothetical protein
MTASRPTGTRDPTKASSCARVSAAQGLEDKYDRSEESSNRREAVVAIGSRAAGLVQLSSVGSTQASVG